MPGLNIAATSRTPAVVLDDKAGLFSLSGESYPEDITGFFGPIRVALNEAMEKADSQFNVEIKLVYFNSSSARVLMEIMDQMDEKAETGLAVDVKWYCDPDDEITKEFAEDICEDLSHLKFTIIEDMIN